jgi:type I restriction enzyme S subunit
MNPRWNTVPMRTEVKLLSGGTPRKSETRYWRGDIPWVSSGAMKQRRIYDTELRVTEEGAENGTRLIPENTVLVVVRGMSLAKEFRIALTGRPVTFNQDLKALRPSPKVDSGFLFYYLQSQRHAIRDSATDASHGTKKLESQVLESWPLPVPDLAEQYAVRDILSTYDDLIENNRQRIQLLEQAARLLYKEWFVHLRFPGHEHVKIKDGVPEGWEKKPLSDLCRNVRESANPKELPPETAYIGLEHIPRRSITLKDWGGAAEVDSSKFKFAEGDILFGKIRPYFHKVGFALVDGIASSDAIIIRPTDCHLYHYVLFLLSSDEFVALASKTVREGSKMPRADWKFLHKTEFKTPPATLLGLFDDTVRPICNQLRNLALHNKQLTNARDLLLPRLMSGGISTS